MPERTRVEIVEVGPRDGLQNESVLVPTEAKVDMIARAVAAGVRRIEVTSFVHPDRVPQMADAEAVMAAVPRREDVRYIGLVLNRRGVERALAAGVDEVNYVVTTTDTFSQRNQGVSTGEALAIWEAVAGAAHAAGTRVTVTIGAAFGCPFEGEVPVARIAAIADRVLASGPTELALADTIGVGVPTQVRSLVDAVGSLDVAVPLRFHFHNTRNTGLANAWTAVQLGAGALDASVGGIGGCPFAPAATGNIPTEDLVYLLDRGGVRSGVSLERVIDNASWMAEQLGGPVPGLLGKAGIFPPPSVAAADRAEATARRA